MLAKRAFHTLANLSFAARPPLASTSSAGLRFFSSTPSFFADATDSSSSSTSRSASASVVDAPSKEKAPPVANPTSPNHGLRLFFHTADGAPDEMVAIKPPSESDASGRSWRASELRLKSSADLHTLWYVLLMERNRLASSRDELARYGNSAAVAVVIHPKLHRVRKSMARIKLVLNERRLAHIEARKMLTGSPDFDSAKARPSSSPSESPAVADPNGSV